MLDSLLQDLRYAVRALRRRPLLAAAGILTLAVGIAANTTVFSVLNTALFKAVPGVTRPERLVEISRAVGGTNADVTHRIFAQLRDQHQVLDGLAALSLESVSLSAGGDPVVRGALAISGDYFALLGATAAIGRTFAPNEATFPAVAPVAVISHEAWQREFGGDPAILGRIARINGAPFEVIGVMPPGFAGHHTALLVDVFFPLGVPAQGLSDPADLARGEGSLELLGRLRSGIEPGAAERQLTSAVDRVARETGEANPQHPYRVQVDGWGPLPGAVRGAVAAFLGVLLLLVALALTMACVNVTTVLLARASERQRELAIRRAIGAGERRLVRQMVTEVAVLFVAAGILGVLAAAWITGLIRGVTPPVALPGRLGADFSLDFRVLGFSLLLTLGGALAFSFLPALQATRFPLGPTLREGGVSDTPGRLQLRAGLIGVQVALTSVLLAATLIAARALVTLRALEPSWNGDDVLVTSFDLEHNGTADPAGQLLQQAMREQLAALPGVSAVALATKLPMGGRSSFGLVWREGLDLPAERQGFEANVNRVSPDYLRVMRIALRAGRDFTPADDERAPRVAIINETLARRLWPGESPLDRTFHASRGELQRDFRVVGVAADAELRAPGQAPVAFYYVPLAQAYNAAAVLHVRALPGRGPSVAAALHGAMRELDPTLPLPSARPLDEALAIYLLPQRLATWVAGLMSAFGLLLAALGVYGISAFMVARRSREVAVRMALGATPASVTRLLIRRNGPAPLAGLAVGVVLAVGATVVANQVMTGISIGDPFVVLGAPLLVGLIAALAVVAPVQRFLRQPLTGMLRDE